MGEMVWLFALENRLSCSPYHLNCPVIPSASEESPTHRLTSS
jgi:hypothetical protein